MNIARIFTALVALSLLANSALAQFGPQVTITTPSHTISDSFYERNGIDFDFNIGGFKFRQGSFDAAIPTVGGYTGDGAGAHGGFAFGKGKNQGRVRFAFGQGSSRTHSMQAPVLTISNGQQGFVTNTTQIPFVTNVVPIVNNWQGPINAVPINFAAQPGYGQDPVTGVTPYYGDATADLESRLRAAALSASRDDDRPRRAAPRGVESSPKQTDKHAERLDAARGSSAGHPAPSIAAIRAAQADASSADNSEALSYFRRGQEAEARGKLGVAKIYYRNALQTAAGELRDEISQRLSAIEYRK